MEPTPPPDGDIDPMVKRTSHRLLHDPSRVIAKPYLPGEEISTDTGDRAPAC